MNYELIVRTEAEQEIEEAYNWYEEQSTGLGKEFLSAIEAAMFTAIRDPLAYQLIHKEIRRVLLRRFPHALFYIVEKRRIIITACFHKRRHPINWKKRT